MGCGGQRCSGIHKGFLLIAVVAKSTANSFICRECGAAHSRWQGQCRECGQWSTLEQTSPAALTIASKTSAQVQTLQQIEVREQARLSTGMQEFDRVLGGGLVAGAVVLIGGNPGAGKSTLLLQSLAQLCTRQRCLYVSGEESLEQIALSAQRLGLAQAPLPLLNETSVQAIIAQAQAQRCQVLVVDSIQVVRNSELSTSAGTVAQVRECAQMLTNFAKSSGCAVLMIGHVTKEGSLAGPKVLEHIIDCSLLLESSSDSRFRLLRAHKNRFGAVNELGIFAMVDNGMREVRNPSALFLSGGSDPAPGSIITVAWEGSRPLLVEIQALLDDSAGGYPRRLSVGVDANRLNMLIAVVHKHGGLALHAQDVYLNLVGGVRIESTSADLPVALALVSGFKQKVLPAGLVAFGEVGLTGEVRPVPYGAERIKEAVKHGMRKLILPRANLPRGAKTKADGVELVAVDNLAQALPHCV